MDNLTHLIDGFGSALTPTNLLFACVGVLLGTLMTGNVWFVIIPSQRELIAATEAGREQAREHARQDQARAQQLARESRDRGMRPERSETRAR